MGFNTGSVGIAVIGDYGSTAITPAARAALVSLIAWRLDLAHVDPLSKVVRVSAGNPRYRAGAAVTLNAISGHRDVYPTSCPGASLYAQLPSIRIAVAQTGLPKLYSPAVTGTIGGPVRFTARLSNDVPWTVTVRDDAGATIASGSGTGTKVDWTWDATPATEPHYTWTITAPQLRPASGSLGTATGPLAVAQLKVAPGILSPNGDGRGDQAKVTYRLSAAAMVDVAVEDAAGTVIATVFSGQRAAGKQELSWSPDALPDGFYTLALTATAGTKQVAVSTRFSVDRTLAATAATPAISPNGDGLLDTAAIGFTLVQPAHVEVRVVRKSKTVATLLTADLPAGPQELSWDGAGLPDGRYAVVVSTTDSLLTAAQSVPVTIDRRAPVLRLLSFRTLVFRATEPGKLVLAMNGRWHAYKVRKAGLVHIRPPKRLLRLTAFLADRAGNKSRVIKARR
jgi:flagellar hook assembly protein FlgD